MIRPRLWLVLIMLEPIAYPWVNWPKFLEICKDSGITPTRGLDVEGIRLDDPAAFLACLSLDNLPSNNLSVGLDNNTTFQHATMTCAGVMNSSLVAMIPNYITAHIITKEVNKYDRLVIVTANMFEWINGIIRACNAESDSEVRQVFSQLYLTLLGTSFRWAFAAYDKKKLSDGTYHLWRR